MVLVAQLDGTIQDALPDVNLSVNRHAETHRPFAEIDKAY
jgi:hypothetical protein